MSHRAAFKIRVPTDAINDNWNPSLEGTGGFSGTSASVTRITTTVHSGKYAVQMTPTGTGGLNLTTRTMTNEARVMTAWIVGTPTAFRCNGVDATPVPLETDGSGFVRWGAPFDAATCNGQTSWSIRSTNTLVVDDAQSEVGDLTTYTTCLHGDMGDGYRWLSTRYASASKRLATWRGKPVWSGGRVVDLDDGKSVLCELAVGLGVTTVTPIADETASGRGQVYRKTNLGARNAKLTFIFLGRSLENLTEVRAAVLSLIPTDRPFALIMDIGNTLQEGRFVYKSGLEGNWDGFTERVAIELEAYDPAFYELHETSVSLTTLATPSATYLAVREEGVWKGYGSGPRGPVRCVTVAPDQTVYVGTDNVSGVAWVQRWTGEAWDEVCWATGSLTSGPTITTLALTPDGATLLVGGDYNTIASTLPGSINGANGVAACTLATKTVAKVPGAGTGLSGGVALASKVDPSGTYWVVGGTFTSVNGVSANHVARYNLNTQTWSALSTGMDNAVRCVACAVNGDYYVGGDFGAAGGLSTPSAPTLALASGGALVGGRTYYYKLSKLTVNGETNAGAAASITTDSTNKTVNLSWSADAGATGWRVWARDIFNPTGPYYLLATLGAVTAYTDNGSAVLDTSQTAPTANTSGHRTPRVARWDNAASQWRSVGVTGFSGGVLYALDLFPDQQTLVAAGTATSADGTSGGGVFWTSGGVWLPLGVGLSGGAAYAVKRTRDGRVWVGGAFTSADGNTLAARLARFDGFPTGVWQHVDLTPAGTVYALDERWPDEIVVGHASTVTDAAASTTVTHSGTGDWRPLMIVEGPGTLRRLAVYETGDELLLTHTLVSGEQLVIDVEARTAVSNVMGDVRGKVRPGSTLDTLRFPSGASHVQVHLTGGGSVRLTGRPTNVSVDKAAP